MKGVEVLFSPKIFECPLCGGTLVVDENGIQRWYDADGNQGTYIPSDEEQ